MERERLTRLLEDPGRMVREDLADLKAMAQQYPWFSGARLLQAAGERLSGQVMGDETLRTAAAHLPSRSVLFDLANQVSRPAPAPLRVVHAEPVAAPPPAPAPPAAEAAPLAVDPTPAEPPTEPVALQPAEPAIAPVVGEPVPPEAQVEAPPIEVPAPAMEALPVPEPEMSLPVLPAPEPAPEPEDSAAALEAEYVKSALAQAYDLTWQEQLEETSGPSMPEPDPFTQPKPISAAPDSEQAAASKPAPRTASKMRFTDWLQQAELGAATAPHAAAVPGPAPAKPAHAQPAPGPPASSAPLDPKVLIDRFIRQQPADIPPRPAFFTPQQAAKKSLDDSSGIVTETLARIYEQQGNFGKAMEAYRRLALKYPEKSAYFAALSKALEDKQTP